MKTDKINFNEKFSRFNDYWSPRIISELNDYQFKVVKIKDEFVWHSHTHTDEAFIVLDGEMWIKFTNKENTKGFIYKIRDPRNLITSMTHHYSLNYEQAYSKLINYI